MRLMLKADRELEEAEPSRATRNMAGSKKNGPCELITCARASQQTRQKFQHHWQVLSMAARVTHYPAQVLRGRQSMLPVPPVHRGAMLSSLIWSLSNQSASMPYHGLKPTCPPAPAFSQVIKRGMATMPASKHSKPIESDEDALARFHRAVRDEGESFIDMWSLPLETLGVSPLLRVWGSKH